MGGTRQCVLCAVCLAPRLDARLVCKHTHTHTHTRAGIDSHSVLMSEAEETLHL